jgi:hypothetical protein
MRRNKGELIMGQAKLRGTQEERILQSLIKTEIMAWRNHEVLEKEFAKSKQWHKQNFKPFSITRSELVNQMRMHKT